ncbi:MAG: flavin reductase family protein [Candidatus Hodarchaeota archaeon]
MVDIFVESSPAISSVLVPVPTIITTLSKEGVPNTSTLSYMTAIHWKPPSILMSIDSKHKTARNLYETSKFTVNVLKHSDLGKEIAYGVGSISGNKTKKFNDLVFLEETAIEHNEFKWPPIINGAILALHGIIVKESTYFGQILFIGEIKAAKMIKDLQKLASKDKTELRRVFEEIALTTSDVYSYLADNF